MGTHGIWKKIQVPWYDLQRSGGSGPTDLSHLFTATSITYRLPEWPRVSAWDTASTPLLGPGHWAHSVPITGDGV